MPLAALCHVSARGSSRPLLSPRLEEPLASAGDPPLRVLASRLSRGAAAAVVMLFLLGAWLLASPVALGYTDHAQAWNDVTCGVLVLVLAIATLVMRRPWLSWIAGAIGIWLLLAPLVLWSPSAAAYLNVTITGSLIAAAGLLFPLGRRLTGPDIPEGWSYNPSAWKQRLPVIVLAVVSFVPAAYMAAFQLGYLDRVWDPVFGAGTERVLTSEVSRAFPISDAGLGAATYLIDLLMTCAGDRRRWRTLPWLVILFGLLIVPVGVVSIVLIMLQPVAVGAWCGWCLLTAIATLLMIPLALDEVAATLQVLRAERRAGRAWSHALWWGVEHGAAAEPAPRRSDTVRLPWALGAMAAAGLWVMLQPAVLGSEGALASSSYITGALVVVVAVVAISEVGRALRLTALPLAAWIAIAPWILADASWALRVSGLAVALVIAVTSLRRGPIDERHGPVDRLVLWPAHG